MTDHLIQNHLQGIFVIIVCWQIGVLVTRKPKKKRKMKRIITFALILVASVSAFAQKAKKDTGVKSLWIDRGNRGNGTLSSSFLYEAKPDTVECYFKEICGTTPDGELVTFWNHGFKVPNYENALCYGCITFLYADKKRCHNIVIQYYSK